MSNAARKSDSENSKNTLSEESDDEKNSKSDSRYSKNDINNNIIRPSRGLSLEID